jgi:endonuclease YncB( thermonuclease family)
MGATPKLRLVGATATDLSKASQPAQSTHSGDKERAYATEVSKKLDKIIQDVEKGTIQWLNHQDRLEKELCRGLRRKQPSLCVIAQTP